MKKIFSVELTNHCNYCCKFCPHSIYGEPGEAGNVFDRPKGFMSEELFDLVLENANKYARTFLIGFFGEQLLHPKFEDFMGKFPTSRPYRINLNTNWSLVTSKHFPILKKVDSVKISLDSTDSKTYDLLCPGGKVLDLDGKPAKDRCQEIIRKTKEWLKASNRPMAEIIFVTSSINKDECKSFIQFWKPYLRKGDIVAVKSVISYGGVMKDSYMSKNECKLYNGGKVNISWDGFVSPCNLDVNMELKVANILEKKDLGKILRSDSWKEILQNIEKKSGVCSNCFDGNNRNHRVFYQK